ncbi:MAG: glycosyltransferase [Candidatus Neomarinimicrobiota bacterium]
MNKKILQIIDILDPGGTERVFVDLCNILNRYGKDVSVLFTREPGILSNQLNENIHQISLNRKFRYSFIAILRLFIILRSYEIIHIHGRYNFFYVKMIMIFFPLRKWKVYFHDHYGAIEIDQSVPLFFRLVTKNYNYIGVSKSLTDWAYFKLGLKNKQIFYLSNIRDIDPVNDFKQRDELKKNKTFELVQVSNIHPIKNIEFSLRLLCKLKEKEKVRLSIYGKISDINYFKSLTILSKSLNLEEDLIFIHDQLNIPSILHKYDLGLCTSKSESGPLVLIEYLSRGLPFVSYRTGEVVSQLTNEYPFFIIDNFDREGWVNRIKEINENKLFQKVNLISTYNKLFSYKSYYNNLKTIYK